MAKKKAGDIYEARISDTKYIKSDAMAFSLEPPETLDRALEQLRESLSHPDTEPGLTPLEFLLRRFEDSAREVLTKNGHPTNRDELGWLIDDHTHPVEAKGGGSGLKCDLEIESLSARRVLLSVSNLREDIASNNAESAAIEMMRIMYAAVNSEMFSLTMQGIRTKSGQSKPKPKRAAEGIKLAVAEVLKRTGKKMSQERIWHYLSRHFNKANGQDPLMVGDYHIFYYEPLNENEPDRLEQEHSLTGETKSITKATFFRHYSKR
jgi:hypothetical protein